MVFWYSAYLPVLDKLLLQPTAPFPARADYHGVVGVHGHVVCDEDVDASPTVSDLDHRLFRLS